MNTREQFGNYLLLKKLGEDPLGETFRAGRVGRQGMEEVVLLRVFNGSTIQGAAFWQKVGGRKEIHGALSSPNIATGVDLGQVDNVPYVVYDYISGKNLANLQKQAAERRNPIPADHALLIAERVALGLAVGYETRLQDQRILHGAVIPDLVMISNEGETRILGFAVAPGVRDAAKTRPEMARYLSPEARAGQAPHKADDVYSLGVILLELLAGKPAPADGDAAALLAGATMQPEGSPLPEELKRLVQQSLAPRDQRIGDVLTWHKSLSKLMFEGQHNPTTFNLAFFMHNLFRDEIEKESQEIEVERTMEIPVPAAVPPPRPAPPSTGTQAAPPSSDLREATGVREDTGVIRDKYGIDEEAAKAKKRNLLLGVAAAVLVTLGVVGFLVFGRGGDSETSPETEAGGQPAAILEPAPPTTAELAAQQEEEAAAAAAETAEAEQRQAELQEQIQSLLDKRLQETEKAYDQEIDTLRKELEAERRKAAEMQRQAEQAAEPATKPPAKPPAEVATKDPATSSAAQPPAAPAKSPATPGDTTAAPTPTQEPVAQKKTPTDTQTPTQTTKRPAAPEPEPRVTTAKRGDLVTMGPGVTPPRIVSAKTPRYPPMAQRLRKEATIVIKILIDEEGRVIETQLAGKEEGYGLDREAESVAESSRWRPATKDGVPVKIWWQMPIKFAL
jgi:TonB family protein